MNLSDKKILLLEDDEENRQRLYVDLLGLGAQITIIKNAKEFLSVCASQPDLLIADVSFENGEFLSLLSQVQELGFYPPVICFASELKVGDLQKALRLGVKDYFEKSSLDQSHLLSLVEKLLSQCQKQGIDYREQLEQANRELREHLRILERDQTAGRRVQRRLMPRGLVTHEGYQVEHDIIPSLFLSGDFIDYRHINQRYLAFYLADVSGHGSSSAFVTVWLKHVVSRMVREEGLFGDYQSFEVGCARMLQQVNRELIDTRIGHHLTFFVGVIDTQTRQLRYVVAGHLPMPILLVDGKANFLEGQGKPVGIFKDASWQIYHRQLPENFVLLCFSDGVLELSQRSNIEEKESDLLEKLSKSTGSLDSVCNTLAISDVKDNPDDIAILSVRLTHQSMSSG